MRLMSCYFASLTNFRDILAAAYNEIRGNRSKEDVPLGRFLTFCAPLVGMIVPENYLAAMGWHMDEALEGEQVSLDGLVTRKMITADTCFRYRNSPAHLCPPWMKSSMLKTLRSTT